MSDRERSAQVAQDKWGNVSDSLRSLLLNERMSDLLKKNLANKFKIIFFSMFYIGFFYLKNERFAHILCFGEQLVSNVIESLRLVTINEQYEQIAQVAHQKWATMSDLLRSLTKNKGMSESLVFLSKLLTHSLIFGQKWAIHSETDEQIPSPAKITHLISYVHVFED